MAALNVAKPAIIAPDGSTWAGVGLTALAPCRFVGERMCATLAAAGAVVRPFDLPDGDLTDEAAVEVPACPRPVRQG